MPPKTCANISRQIGLAEGKVLVSSFAKEAEEDLSQSKSQVTVLAQIVLSRSVASFTCHLGGNTLRLYVGLEPSLTKCSALHSIIQAYLGYCVTPSNYGLYHRIHR
jgi:hypothetical protein